MQITSIDIKNFIGARDVTVALETPVTLIAGPNGAGKSSVAEAIRHALIGEAARVKHKKDYGALLHDGASAGHALIQTSEGDVGILLPDGKQIGGDFGNLENYLPYCLDPSRFAALDDSTKRTLLFNLMGIRITAEHISHRLSFRGCDLAKSLEIRLHLSGGFDPAAKEASAKARDAKAAWRVITGETYGEKKAEGWAAFVACEVPSLVLDDSAMAELDADVDEASAALGALEQRRRAYDGREERLAVLRDKADKAPRIKEKLAHDIKDRDDWKAKVEEAEHHVNTGNGEPCPHCGGLVQLNTSTGKIVAFDGTVSKDDAFGKLPEYREALRLMENAVKNGERDLAEANAAAEALKQFDADSEQPPTEEEIEAARNRLNVLKASRKQSQDDIQAVRDAKRKTAEAEEKTRKAAAHHADVLAWDKIADALSPDGIPAELLAEALEPFNTSLEKHAEASLWRKVRIDQDMTVNVDGKPYALRSESEKWRADAMIAAAIAEISGAKVMLLDRFDVLDLNGRADAVAWLDSLSGVLDTIIVLGTLKAPPKGLPDSITALWIEGGTVAGEVAVAA